MRKQIFDVFHLDSIHSGAVRPKKENIRTGKNARKGIAKYQLIQRTLSKGMRFSFIIMWAEHAWHICVHGVFCSGLRMACPCQVNRATHSILFWTIKMMDTNTCLVYQHRKMSSQCFEVSYFWSLSATIKNTHNSTVPLNWNVSKMTTNIEICEEFPLMFWNVNHACYLILLLVCK